MWVRLIFDNVDPNSIPLDWYFREAEPDWLEGEYLTPSVGWPTVGGGHLVTVSTHTRSPTETEVLTAVRDVLVRIRGYHPGISIRMNSCGDRALGSNGASGWRSVNEDDIPPSPGLWIWPDEYDDDDE
jgi:hypothetical protein